MNKLITVWVFASMLIAVSAVSGKTAETYAAANQVATAGAITGAAVSRSVLSSGASGDRVTLFAPIADQQDNPDGTIVDDGGSASPACSVHCRAAVFGQNHSCKPCKPVSPAL